MPPNSDPYQQQPMQQPQPMGSIPIDPATGQPIAMQTQQPIGTAPQPQQPMTKQQQATVQSKTDGSTSQKSLLFSEVRDNMLIMADGGFRAVIACESINFDLMSSRERETVEYSYQSFLNSLNFDIQVLIRSQRIDISPYINKIATLRRAEDNMLLGVLMDSYIDFIDELSVNANIMDKQFYIVVPYALTPDVNQVVEKGKNFFGSFIGKPKPLVTSISTENYNKARGEVSDRVDVVLSGLYQLGVKCDILTTRQLSELFYNFYNPDTAVREPLGDINNVNSLYVKKAAEPPAQMPTPGGYYG